MKIVAVQLDIAWEDKPSNFDKVRRLLERESIEPGSLILLPEMFATGFSMNVDTISRNEPDLTREFLLSLARDHRSFTIGGVVTKAPEGLGRNQALVCNPEGRVQVEYTKLHPFSFSGETQYYRAGDRMASFEWGPFAVAPFVCYDLRFPEIFRHAVQARCNLFTVIANWPQAREEHWVTLLKARAIENQAYVAGVNRCGSDPKHAYSGRSLILDPRGVVLADAGDRECVIQAVVDCASLEQYRRDFPALSDIRPEYRFDPA